MNSARRLERRNDVLDELLEDWQRERPEIDTAAMSIVGRIIYLSGLLQIDANKALKPFNIRYTDFDVLATLRRRGDPFEKTPTQLRQSVLITSGAMTACLDRLEKSGFIRRQPDPNDRRGTIVKMTPAGKSLIDAAIVPRFEVAAEVLAALSKTERDKLSTLLKKLTVSHGPP